MDRAGVEEGVEGVEGVELLTERNRDRGCPGQGAVGGDVIVPERLLEPEQIIGLGPGAEAHAGREIPFPVAVHRNGDAVANRPAHLLDAGEVGVRVGMTDLELDAPETAFSTAATLPATNASSGIESQPMSVL